MAAIVAYVSVGGLLKVFSGAGTLGLLFFSAIEIAKIVATSAIHTYSKKITWVYKAALSLGIGIAMVITSVGIYGFLSSTYQETFMKLENVEAQVSLLEKKRNGFQVQLDNVISEKTSIDGRISDLSKGLSNNVIQYKDPETGQLITTTSSSTRKALEKQLDGAMVRQDALNIKSDGLNDKVYELDNQIVEVKLGNDSAAELGPLKYLSEVTGKSMDEVMKYFIFLLIIIGDPMAVLMVIVFNKIVKKNEEDETPEVIEEIKQIYNKPIKYDTISEEEVKETIEIEEVENIGEEASLEDFIEEEIDTEDQELLDQAVIDDLIVESLEEDDEEYDENDYPAPNVDLLKVAEKYKELATETEDQESIELDKVDQIITNDIGDMTKEDWDRLNKMIEDNKNRKIVTKVTVEDIKEKREERKRGFSVPVPDRKKNNTVDRIGSNKETRNGDTDTVFFKRR